MDHITLYIYVIAGALVWADLSKRAYVAKFKPMVEALGGEVKIHISLFHPWDFRLFAFVYQNRLFLFECQYLRAAGVRFCVRVENRSYLLNEEISDETGMPRYAVYELAGCTYLRTIDDNHAVTAAQLKPLLDGLVKHALKFES